MDVTPTELRDAMRDVDFPAGKDALLSAAEATGAEEHVLQALRSVPPGVEYANKDEVIASVRHPRVGTGPTAGEAQQPHRDHDQGRLAERAR